MATIRIDQAKHGELLAFITGQLNLDLPDNPTRPQLIEIIRNSGYQPKSFDLDASEMRPSGAQAPRSGDGDYTHVKLTIGVQDGFDGSRPVSLIHNGVRFDVPRGEPVEVPRKYYEGVLLNAVVVLYPEKQRFPIGESALVNPVMTPRFPITVHGFVNKAMATA
jgi:hypothetical protein